MADINLINLVYARYSKSSVPRLAGMIRALRIVENENIAGDIVECGVWRGGNIMLARKICPDRICWLYDTFTGMTEPDEFDSKISSGESALARYRAKGGVPWQAENAAQVKQYFRETQTFDESKLNFVIGPVEMTLIESPLPERIALLRLDTDWHSSTKVEMEKLYPRLAAGGVLIVDDYGHWTGARKAIDEYFGVDIPEMEWLDYTAIMMRKPC